LRIISGKLKGRKLASFKGQCIRPTSDRVREAIFDILNVEWDGKEVLDLFAGTGGLGIEALSRGARLVVFVENHPQALQVLEKNLKALNLIGNCELVRLRAEAGIRFLERNMWKFDVAFLDPPYNKNLAYSTLSLIADSDILKKNGVVVVEHYYKETFSEEYRKLKMSDQRKYGETGVSFFISN
jgi:16S rRNA (guanine(966)-N(2))-methyltransferase RsmD